MASPTPEITAEMAIQKLVGFAMTCRRRNTVEWMWLCEQKLNDACEASGSAARVVFDGYTFRFTDATEAMSAALYEKLQQPQQPESK